MEIIFKGQVYSR